MARSINDIYNALATAQSSEPLLAGLSPSPDVFTQFITDLANGSKVATWRLFLYLMAVGIFAFETILDIYLSQIQVIADEAPTGTPRWYRAQALAYQHGDLLVYSNGRFSYPTINTSNQIVKLCAVIERADGFVLIKVANLDGSGNPLPLTPTELTAFEGYISQIKFAGTRTISISTVADLIKIYGQVYYSPELVLSNVQTLVEAAINTYLKSLPFNGVFSLTALQDAVQRVPGIVDFRLDTVATKYAAFPYVNVTRNYTAYAGYLGIDASFPLATTLTYNASII